MQLVVGLRLAAVVTHRLSSAFLAGTLVCHWTDLSLLLLPGLLARFLIQVTCLTPKAFQFAAPEAVKTWKAEARNVSSQHFRDLCAVGRLLQVLPSLENENAWHPGKPSHIYNTGSCRRRTTDGSAQDPSPPPNLHPKATGTICRGLPGAEHRTSPG